MDDYTEKLLERSKARKDFLKNKLPERKRRTALLDENHISPLNSELNQPGDDSPKRQCLDSEGIKNLEDKENSNDEFSFVPFVASEKKGLAALKRNQICSDESEEQVIPTINVTESEESQGFVKSPSTTKITYNFLKNKKSKDYNEEELSSDEEMDRDEISDHCFEDEMEADRTVKEITSISKSDFIVSDMHFEKVLSPNKNQSPRKFESTISPKLHSPSKIAQKMSPNKLRSPQKSETLASPVKFDSSRGLSQIASPCKVRTPQKITSSPLYRNTSFIKLNPKANSMQNVESHEEETIDPADLPLSARKAIFEKAFFNSPVKVENKTESNLSVAQRAALFEKSATSEGHKDTQKEAQKVILATPTSSRIAVNPVQKSPTHSILLSNSAEKKTGKVFPASSLKSPLSTNEPAILSPSKSAGVHTRSVQQRLIDNSSTDWRKKDIVAKASEERKSEISALLNHWEKVSSSENTISEIGYHPVRNTLTETKKNVNTFAIEKEQEGEYESECEDSQESDNEGDASSEMESSVDDNISESHSPVQNNDSNFTSSKHDSLLSQSSTDIANDVMTVCDEMNEILDAAVSHMSTPPILPPSSLSSKGSSISFTSSTSSSGSPPPQREVFKTPCKVALPQSSNSGDSDTPLLHTISFYRKQKQQKRTTPVQTIVRKEHIASPPSPEVDTAKLIQEKIKILQGEICAQQTVISQTSQALNLCHATEEFFGSTEQVEGERLLLIATQKRQALLNEVHRLKTHGALGEKLCEGSGTLVIHDIALPLKREFIASQLQIKGGSDAIHYFLCLLRHGPQVIVTQMLSTTPNEVSNGSLCFTNHITIRNLSPDFSVVFEVYALQTKKEVLPHEKKYHIKKDHSKLRLTPKSKKNESKLQMPVISSPGGPNAVRTPSFGVVGFTRFTLQNHQRKTYTLDKVPFSSPLDGVLLVKMQLDTEYHVSEKGFLTMFEDVSGFGAWHRRWCVLRNYDLSFWKYPDDEKRKAPILQFDMRQCITNQVKLVPREVCARQHTFELLLIRPSEKGERNTLISESVNNNTLTRIQYLLSADTKEERILWCKRLNESLTNVRRWNPSALRPMEIKK